MVKDPQIYRKPLTIVPGDDDNRVERLSKYEILDSGAEEAFDKIARLAAQIFESSGAFISFIDKERVYFKSNLSDFPFSEVSRKDSLCSLTILDQGVTVFTDTHQIPGLLESPYVSCAGGIRFYAGASLTTPDGYKIGSICVTDDKPRDVLPHQLQMLETLSTIVMDELELRLTNRKALRVQTDLMNMAVHDLKNPMSSIVLYAKLMTDESTSKDEIHSMGKRVLHSSQYVLNSLNDLLNLSQIEQNALNLNTELVELHEILDTVKNNLEILAHQKGQRILLESSFTGKISMDKTRMQEAFENLLSNSIKYAYPQTEIHVRSFERDGSVFVEFADMGQGLSELDLPKLFTKFSKLSSIPTGNERSNGLGLSIVKALVELHSGTVSAFSEGKDKGSTFRVTLPL